MLSVWKSNNTMPQNVILQNGKCFLIHLPTSSTILLQKILGNNTTVKILLCKMAMLCQASWLLGNLGYTKKKYFEFSVCVSFSSVCDASPRVSLCAGLAWQTVSAPSPRTNHLLENWKTTTANMETNEKMVIWNGILEGIHLWETPIMGDNWEILNLCNAHIPHNPCPMLGQSRVERILENSLGSSPADNPVPGHLLPIPQKTDLENNCSLFDLFLSLYLQDSILWTYHDENACQGFWLGVWLQIRGFFTLITLALLWDWWWIYCRRPSYLWLYVSFDIL